MRYMTAERHHELRSECAQDLAHARKVGHKAWAETLSKRLAWLDALVSKGQDKCLIAKKKEK